MCGIIGYKNFSSQSDLSKSLKKATDSLKLRGPNNQGTFIQQDVGLGHTRLSILDTSSGANQPMTDPSGRYVIVFNGEIYNYQGLKSELDISFKTTSDTEVLLHLLINEGEKCLPKLNGFFAFAFYDKKEDRLLLARDRMGIKPLLFYQDENQFLFGSEMKALMCFPTQRKLNKEALYWYLKLNYLPGTLSMLEGVQKLAPGHYLKLKTNQIEVRPFISKDGEAESLDYENGQKELVDILEESVKKRMISDVPLGAFLSGGTDSSAIVSLASRHTSQLSTFSVGYEDQPFFDETYYAELVAKKFNTNHHTFKLTNDDLLNDLNDIIEYIDEPFADSSAIPTYILSKHTKKHVTVALSGDGADELFGGYYKHMALNQALHPSFSQHVIKSIYPAFNALPKSRSGKVSNLIRRICRYGEMLKMEPIERYWFLASLTNDPSFLLYESINVEEETDFKSQFFKTFTPDLNDYLLADQQMLLPGDMLTKVDLMSMANGLEVRVPFLDKNVVNFARSIPAEYKIKGANRKRLVQDAFQNILPKELHNRPKKGFEIPLLQWMRNELLSDLDKTVFNEDYLQSQNLFNIDSVMNLRVILLSKNPNDVHGIIWAMYIFQKWYMKWMDNSHNNSSFMSNKS
ncbi:asparagine synthase (glutamine-hydrolyzing) [Ekhidna sp.]